ncbi:MAG: hypothetical protein KKC76_05490 [Proteobacteria bacterium]|nr:hypothetical protein [Pseudomonadota bacterium]MBU4294262.1 hypothetical protein [Pseudomonadota bacterium]MCG2747419.1 hypothetical protein [Desulfobulbaceae bacterium]
MMMMKQRIMLLVFSGLLVTAATAGAREVRLQAGEIYQTDDLTITCQAADAGQAMAPLSVKECQYWDDFNNKCLFEKNILTYRSLECVEDCQHWDSFRNTCDYQSKCAFYPAHESFVRTTCDEFDDFKRKCLRTRETKIGSSGRGRR